MHLIFIQYVQYVHDHFILCDHIFVGSFSTSKTLTSDYDEFGAITGLFDFKRQYENIYIFIIHSTR